MALENPANPGPTAIIGMLHLLPLPGSPRFDRIGGLDKVRARLLADAKAMVEGGVDALMLENFGDVPFTAGRVGPETVAVMTALGQLVRQQFPSASLGVNVLRNDGLAALAVAEAIGARFIRVNVLCGARVTDQGVLQGIAHDLMRARSSRGLDSIKVMADVDVKHSTALGQPTPIEQDVHDLVHRGMADVLIVSGGSTGHAPAIDHVRRVSTAAGKTPVLIGSGATAQNVGDYAAYVDGYIVGTSVKRGGDVHEPVLVDRVREFVAAVRRT